MPNLGTGLDYANYPTLAQQNAQLRRPTGLGTGTDPALGAAQPGLGVAPTGAYGNTGLLGQTTPPVAPKLSDTWNSQSGFNLSSVLAQLQKSQDQANQANVTRYNNLLTSIGNTGAQVGGTYNQALGLMDTQGQAAATRIGQQTEQNIAGNQQGLVSRGLGNTTIGVNLDQQARQQGEQALQASNEAVAGQKAGILQNQAGAQMGIGQMNSQGIQSLTQQAPNMQLYSDMIKQASQGDAAKKAATAQNAAQIGAQISAMTDKWNADSGWEKGGSSSSGGGGGLSPSTPSSGGGGGGGGGTYLSGGGTGGGSFSGGPTGNLSSAASAMVNAASGGGGMGQYPNLAQAAGAMPSAGAQDFATGSGGVAPDTMEIPSKPEITAQAVTGQGGVSAPTTAAAGQKSETYAEYLTRMKKGASGLNPNLPNGGAVSPMYWSQVMGGRF